MNANKKRRPDAGASKAAEVFLRNISIITEMEDMSMAIGILALIVGGTMLIIGSIGIRDVEPPVRKERAVSYPFPEEI